MKGVNHVNPARRIEGVGLLEVLIAVAVLAIGILALASFQGQALLSGNDARARTIATNIAQDKMEELRGFVDDPAQGFSQITSDLVGETKSAADTGTNTNYTTTWEVTKHVFETSDAGAIEINQADPRDGDFKKIEVTVAWDDERGTGREVTLESYINSSDSVKSGEASFGEPSSPEKPKIGYTPLAAPEVISISDSIDPNINPLTIREAASPEPQVVGRSGTNVVTFDEVTYDANAVQDIQGNDTFLTLRRESFLTLNCICQLGRSDGQPGLAPTVLDIQSDGFADDTWVVGEAITGKTVGRAATGNVTVTVVDDQGNQSTTTLQMRDQPELCDTCCRDHHDGGTNNDLHYDPFRNTGSTDHNHYKPQRDINGNLVLATQTDDLYLEACRFNLVDGIHRAIPDWRLELFKVIPSQTLQTSAGISAYQDYAKQFIKGYISAIDTQTYPATTPTSDDFSSADETAFLGAESTLDTEILSASTMSTSSQPLRQMIARGVYIDHMDDDLIDRLQCKISGLGGACSGADPNWLSEVPFHEVNLTRLANWKPSISDIDPATVPAPLLNAINLTSEAIPAGANPSYSRGRATALGQGTVNALAKTERSNTGITDTYVVDEEMTNGDDDTLAGQVLLTVTGTSQSQGFVVSGGITVQGNLNVDLNSVNIATPTSGVSCFKNGIIVSGNTETLSYTCLLGQNTGFDLVISGYNYSVQCSGQNAGTGVFDNEITGSITGVVANNATLIPGEKTTFSISVSQDTTHDFVISRGNGRVCP